MEAANWETACSVEFTVPAAAAEGSAKVLAKTTQTGVSITKAYTVN